MSLRAAALACALCALAAGMSGALAQTQDAPPATAQEAPTIVQPPPEPQDASPRIIEAPTPPPRPRPRPRAPAAEPPEPSTDFPAAITDRDIAVTSDYQGFDVTVFGYNPEWRRGGDIVVALRGPTQPTVVRRKFRFLAFWVNGDPVRFEEAPSFLAVYSDRPLNQIASPRLILALGLDPAASARLAGQTPPGTDASDYRRALVRLRRAAGLYIENPNGLRIDNEMLFQAQISIPANAPIGDYTADVYYFRDQRLISSRQSQVKVSREGIERQVHEFASDWPFVYGLLTVAIALLAGWLAAIVFRRT